MSEARGDERISCVSRPTLSSPSSVGAAGGFAPSIEVPPATSEPPPTTTVDAALLPAFLGRHNTTATVHQGDTATLACHVVRLGDKTVSWVRRRGSDFHILTVGFQTYHNDNSFPCSSPTTMPPHNSPLLLPNHHASPQLPLLLPNHHASPTTPPSSSTTTMPPPNCPLLLPNHNASPNSSSSHHHASPTTPLTSSTTTMPLPNSPSASSTTMPPL
ncbi:hypothetical protein GWK47_019980 [Chionoecetes opilio]|uniref:Ig-like domain-containing protein n=1 Tax=Chionoecetes opilio TaxID=41210 RepID=A0A8J5CIL3_CHIOP|nr:hypothetical protein GWK47_019980 [Chionoecetes opilio]